jgi:hypothetical protein
LVTGDDFLVYDSRVGVFHRYPVERGMSFGREDRFGTQPEVENRLMAELAWIAPAPFADELDGAAGPLFEKRLASVSQATSDAELAALGRIASLRPGEFDDEIETAIANAGSADRQVAILAGVQFSNPSRWSPHVRALLVDSLNGPREIEVVRALVDHSPVVNVSGPQILNRLLQPEFLDDEERLLRWLLLLRQSETGGGYVGVYDRWRQRLERRGALTDDRVRLMLEAIGKLKISTSRGGPAGGALAEWVRGLVSAEPRGIAERACHALGSVGSSDQDLLTLQEIAADRSARVEVRRAALRSVVRLQGQTAKAFLLERATDPVLAPVAFDGLAEVGDYDTVVALKKMASDAESPLTRELAKNSAQTLWGRIVSAGGKKND